MDVKLYVGNLPFDSNEQYVRDLFAQNGSVVSVALITDRNTGASRGFGFVEMSSQADAQAAIRALDGKVLGDRPLVVNLARDREEKHGLPRRIGPRNHAGRGKGKRY